jgi:hypothetical protein
MLEGLKPGGTSGSEPGMLGTKGFLPAPRTGWNDGFIVLNCALLLVSITTLGIKGT